MPHQPLTGRLTHWLARTLDRFAPSRAAAGPPSPLRGGDGGGGITPKSLGPYFAFDRLGQPAWAPRDYSAFAREGFMQNAILYRAVRMIAEAAASVPLLLYAGDEEIAEHPLLALLARPNAAATAPDLLEALYGFLLVSGNAYLEALPLGPDIRELHTLRPDRMKVVPGADGWPAAFEYTVDGTTRRLAGEAAPGVRRVLHLKLFHPLNDHYGLSPIEAAAQAVDIHNTASKWNKALLDNSARPSGALVYTARDGNLTIEQYDRLKAELEQGFAGAARAGRPLLLEGGLDWKSMSMSPKDMDFIEAKHVAAREIALALGVPPMLLGIPGDNTYSNYQEATRTFWRSTVLPLVTRTAKSLSTWLAPAYTDAPFVIPELRASAISGTQGPRAPTLDLRPDLDSIEALSTEREALWTRIDKATFLTQNEKRAAVGYGPVDGGDAPSQKAGFRVDQPRVPAGQTGGGQWVGEGGGGLVHQVGRTGGGRRPPPRPPQPPRRQPPPGIGHNRPPRDPPPPQAIQQAISDYRFIHNLGGRDVVAYAPGLPEGSRFGVNSTANSYEPRDRYEAQRMRDDLIYEYPDVMEIESISLMPNNALFHAETTLLLRAARANGGSLAGLEFEVHVDGRNVCNNCQRVLPYVGLELGNPIVTFVNPSGTRRTMRDGRWIGGDQ